jgi:hypothetical protein
MAEEKKPEKNIKTPKPAPLDSTEIDDSDLEKVTGAGTTTCGCNSCSVPYRRK